MSLCAISFWPLQLAAYAPAPRHHRIRPTTTPHKHVKRPVTVVLLRQAQELIRDFQSLTNPNLSLIKKRRQAALAATQRRPRLETLLAPLGFAPSHSHASWRTSVLGLTTLLMGTHFVLSSGDNTSEALGVAHWAAANAYLIALINRYIRQVAKSGREE